jgi:hypothetical protein
VQPITTAQGVAQQEADALNPLLTNIEQTFAFLEAGIISLNRAQGAQVAGDVFWQTQQTQAAQQYGSQAAQLLAAQPALFASLATAFEGTGRIFAFTQNDISNYIASVVQNGLPTALTQDLSQLGLDSTAITQIRQSIVSADPIEVASLGIGRFPNAIADPSVTAALAQAAVAVGQLAQGSAAGGLTQAFNITVPGDYVAGGVGLRGRTQGNISISDIPAGATVAQALLYWGMLDNGEDPLLKRLTFNGNAVTGTRIGTGPDTCWGLSNSFTYRADVTRFVSGNGVYTLDQVATGGAILADGASLVVIYQKSGSPLRQVVILDGDVVLPPIQNATARISNFSPSKPVSAKTTFIVGDGQAFPASISFTGNAGTAVLGTSFPGSDGPYWDTNTFDVSRLMIANNTPESGVAEVDFSGDCLMWTAQAFSVASSSTSPVTRFDATSAVVQANANGSTTINLRGLNPQDQPSLSDQLSFIVQDRVNKNPSISTLQLTQQLVASLPSSIVPPNQVAGLVSRVVQELVQPAGQPNLSGKLLSSSFQSAGVLTVKVQLSDAGPGTAAVTNITGLAMKTLSGNGTVTVKSPQLPLKLGSMNVGSSATVTLLLSVPSTVTKFSITETGSVQDLLGRTFSFSNSQLIVP